MRTTATICVLLFLISCNESKKKENHQILEVRKALHPISIDGKGIENSWNREQWYALDQNWLGEPYEHSDFNGRYKLTWDENGLYILVEIVDDILYDQTKDPLKLWWNDDCIKVFLDADNSGGLHQFNYNAFAYHIALDGNVVDLAPDKKPKLFNEHIISRRTNDGSLYVWEIKANIFDDTYSESEQNQTKALTPGDEIGFALAYCDNDGSIERENCIGSVFVPGEDKNQAWINADIFGTLILKE